MSGDVWTRSTVQYSTFPGDLSSMSQCAFNIQQRSATSRLSFRVRIIWYHAHHDVKTPRAQNDCQTRGTSKSQSAKALHHDGTLFIDLRL